MHQSGKPDCGVSASYNYYNGLHVCSHQENYFIVKNIKMAQFYKKKKKKKKENIIIIKILFIYFWGGRQGEREEEKHQCTSVCERYSDRASHMPPPGDLACNPGMCPDWESNR